MGYDSKYFAEEDAEKYACIVCTDVVENALACSGCGVYVCEGCKTPECSACRKKGLRASPEVRRMVGDLMIGEDRRNRQKLSNSKWRDRRCCQCEKVLTYNNLLPHWRTHTRVPKRVSDVMEMTLLQPEKLRNAVKVPLDVRGVIEGKIVKGVLDCDAFHLSFETNKGDVEFLLTPKNSDVLFWTAGARCPVFTDFGMQCNSQRSIPFQVDDGFEIRYAVLV